MDQQVWGEVCRAVSRQTRRQTRELGKTPRVQFSDALIVKMHLWSVWHDRCKSWACDKGHYGRLFRPRKLPSISQFTRRIKSPRCCHLLTRVHEDLAGGVNANALHYLDGKPPPVGAVSKDAQAARGHISGGYAKGYKLHAWVTEDRQIFRWSVMPLNVGEPPVIRAVLADMPVMGPASLFLADSSYDGRELFDLLAAKNAAFLPQLRGIGKHPVTVRQAGPVRREAIAAWQNAPELARHVYKRRLEVESVFGELTATAGLLSPIPAWVRGLRRVRAWVGAKIILYHARRRAKKSLQTAA